MRSLHLRSSLLTALLVFASGATACSTGKVDTYPAPSPYNGSASSLKPTIKSVRLQNSGDLALSVETPEEGYITVFQIWPSRMVALYGTSAFDKGDGKQSAGRHNWTLTPVAGYESGNNMLSNDGFSVRSRQAIAALRQPDSYAVVIVSSEPVSKSEMSYAMQGVNLRGEGPAVVESALLALVRDVRGAWSADVRVIPVLR